MGIHTKVYHEFPFERCVVHESFVRTIIDFTIPLTGR